MNIKDIRLLLLLAFLGLSNFAADGLGGFLTGLDPECDCEPDKTAKVTLTPAKLSLIQGENGTSTAEFTAGGEAKAALWSMRKANTKFFKASSLSTSSGSSAQISVTAADSVIPDENWDQGTFYETDSPTVAATGKAEEGGATAVLTLAVWGTQLYWANEDGSVRRWWTPIGENLNPFSSPSQRSWLTDGGDSTEYYLRVNVPGGISADDWDIQVIPKPVQRQTMGDNILIVYSPWASTHQPSEYIETPKVSVNNGIIKVGFKTKDDFPGAAITEGGADMPFEVVVKRKSDGLTVRQNSSISFTDKLLPF